MRRIRIKRNRIDSLQQVCKFIRLLISVSLLYLIEGCSGWQPTEIRFSPSITVSANFSTKINTQLIYVNETHSIDKPVKPWHAYPNQLMPGLDSVTAFVLQNNDTIYFQPDTTIMPEPGYYSANFSPQPGNQYDLFLTAALLPPLHRSVSMPDTFHIFKSPANDTIKLGTAFKVSWTASNNTLIYYCEFSTPAGWSIMRYDTIKPELIIDNFGLDDKGLFMPRLYNQYFILKIKAVWKSNPNTELGEIQGTHSIERRFFATKYGIQ